MSRMTFKGIVDGVLVVKRQDGSEHRITKADFDSASDESPGLKIIHNVPCRWNEDEQRISVGRGLVDPPATEPKLCPLCGAHI